MQCFDNYRKLEEIRQLLVEMLELSNASSSTVYTQRKLEIPTTKEKQKSMKTYKTEAE